MAAVNNWRKQPRGTTSFNRARHKKLWTSLPNGIMFYTVEPTEAGFNEPGDNVIVHLPFPTGHYFLNLSELTIEEYTNLRKIFATALVKAEPIIRERDANAAKLIKDGEVGPDRAYRPIPRLFNPNGEVK